MEAIGASMAREWNCLSEMVTTQEADFMAQLLGSSSGFEASSNCNNNTNLYNLSSNDSISRGSSFLNPSSTLESYYSMSECNISGLINTNKSTPFDMDDDHAVTVPYLVEGNDDQKKRPCGTDNVEKMKRNVRAKKSSKTSSGNDDEECNGGHNGGAASSSCCSEDDSKFASLNPNGKAGASRGAATDPQSLYARKRRERINERLRILQNLVPNGTKVDISTMLEEAIHYVKFLQLQIKLLSSDDLWMCAPIAFNGMDIGLDLNLKTSSQ